MTSTTLPALVVALALAGALLPGCASFALGAGDRGSIKSGTLVENCPLGVPWTRLEMRETPEGAELSFKTTGSNVEELRRRVRDQARANGPNRHRGSGHDGEHQGPRDHGLRLWAMGELEARAEDTPAGAKLIVIAAEPAKRAELRERLASRVKHLQAADCPS